MMVRATDLLFMRILRGHLTKATTGVGSIAASKFTDHGPTEMEDLPLRFAEALKPVYECRYFSTRVWAVAGFVHDQPNAYLLGADKRLAERLPSDEKGH